MHLKNYKLLLFIKRVLYDLFFFFCLNAQLISFSDMKNKIVGTSRWYILLDCLLRLLLPQFRSFFLILVRCFQLLIYCYWKKVLRAYTCVFRQQTNKKKYPNCEFSFGIQCEIGKLLEQNESIVFFVLYFGQEKNLSIIIFDNLLILWIFVQNAYLKLHSNI